MKKNILLGLMLLSVAPVFSADVEAAGVPAATQRGGVRTYIWNTFVPSTRSITHHTVYGVAGAGGAYTIAHSSGACSDGWLGWIGLGGLCSGLYLGNRHYRSAEHETGILAGARDAAQQLAEERQADIVTHLGRIGELNTANGILAGERNAVREEVETARQRLTTESQRHAATEVRSAEEIQRLSGVVAEGLGEVQRTLGVNQGGLRILLGTQIATIRSSRINSIAAGLTLRSAGQGVDADEAAAVVLELDSVLPHLRALQGQAQAGDFLALPQVQTPE